jgi:predicted enzyme related to lactoylglutathione lyase
LVEAETDAFAKSSVIASEAKQSRGHKQTLDCFVGWRLLAMTNKSMPGFRAPQINLYSRDLRRAAAFYAGLGFIETFRTPASGDPAHIELKLDGFTLGIATLEAARDHHRLTPGDGRGIEIVLWTDDTDAALSALVAGGAPVLAPAHDFLDGRLRAAWTADPDGNPIQLVQRKR